jgi:subtilase family serine protease
MPHGGGQRFAPDSEEYRTLLAWLHGGAPPPAPREPVVKGVTVFPAARVMRRGETQRLLVQARLSDGTLRDVTAQALSAAVASTNLLATNTVFNAGNVKQDTVVVDLYLSPDNVITGGGNDILVGTRTIIDLQAGAVSSVTTTISIPGTGVSTGSYFVGMKVDPANAIIETNETNNTRATTSSFLLGPNLQVFSIQGTLAGTNIIVSDTQQNIGNNDAGPFDVSFYFSPIANPNPATDTLIGSRSIAGLGGGSAVNTGSNSFPVPASTPTGTYFLCAITDSGNTVAETNETQASNEKCTGGTFVIGPDLRVLSLSVTQIGGAGGTTFSITDTEQNIGTVAAGAFDVKFYLSLNATFGAGDIQLAPGTRSVSGLAGGSATNTATGTHAVPSGTPAGTYFIIAVSDADAVITETNEGNNTRASASAYTVPAVP